MSDLTIQVADVSKCYQVYERPHDRVKQVLLPRVRRMAGLPPRSYFKEFWALRNVSFDVRRGDTVGIIGRNGSGKSTLLQMICGTLAPTSGEIKVQGRIAALLELGAGFNPEFTGRENVFLSATILGLTGEEIEQRYERILAFADIGEFIEQPVKSYSSGMFVRLAFAVAIHVEPEILVVDEALSVGDEAFQRKCYARIEKIRADGATILFVSHSAGTVLELCNRAILLDHGDVLAVGEPKAVVAKYQKMLYAPSDKAEIIRAGYLAAMNGKVEGSIAPALTESTAVGTAGQLENTDRSESAHFDQGLVSQSVFRYESHGALIGAPRIETLSGRRVNVLVPGGEYVYTYDVAFDRIATCVRFGMLIKTVSGIELGGAVSSSIDEAIPFIEPGSRVRVRFKFHAMVAPGTYFMNAGVTGRVGEEESFLDRLVDAVAFRIPPDIGRLATGFVDFGVESRIEILQDAEGATQ